MSNTIPQTHSTPKWGSWCSNNLALVERIVVQLCSSVWRWLSKNMQSQFRLEMQLCCSFRFYVTCFLFAILSGYTGALLNFASTLWTGWVILWKLLQAIWSGSLKKQDDAVQRNKNTECVKTGCSFGVFFLKLLIASLFQWFSFCGWQFFSNFCRPVVDISMASENIVVGHSLTLLCFFSFFGFLEKRKNTIHFETNLCVSAVRLLRFPLGHFTLCGFSFVPFAIYFANEQLISSWWFVRMLPGAWIGLRFSKAASRSLGAMIKTRGSYCGCFTDLLLYLSPVTQK